MAFLDCPRGQQGEIGDSRVWKHGPDLSSGYFPSNPSVIDDPADRRLE